MVVLDGKRRKEQYGVAAVDERVGAIEVRKNHG